MAQWSHSPNFQAFDQLQDEVNRTLEQVGRLLLAAGGSNKSATAVQAAKLQHIFPESLSRFHDALDDLEHDLEISKRRLRHQLAVARERDGVTKPLLPVVAETIERPDPPGLASAEKVATTEAEPSLKQTTDEGKKEMKHEAHDEVNTEANDEGKDEANVKDESPKPNIETSKPDALLEESSEQPPQSAMTTSRESLFGGPLGDNVGAEATSPAAAAENGALQPDVLAAPATPPADFDFGAFTGNPEPSPDSLSDILPGLKDYVKSDAPDPDAGEVAATGDGGVPDMDFDDFLASIGNGTGATGIQQQQPDDTFADLELDFELPNVEEGNGRREDDPEGQVQGDDGADDLLSFKFD